MPTWENIGQDLLKHFIINQLQKEEDNREDNDLHYVLNKYIIIAASPRPVESLRPVVRG